MNQTNQLPVEDSPRGLTLRTHSRKPLPQSGEEACLIRK